jgi:hypothetical protein
MQRPTTQPDSGNPAQERYDALFEAIDAGFCIIEVMFDGDHAVDYRFVEVNSQFESQTGLLDVVGRTAGELVPDLERFWFDAYGKVALTGEPARFDHGSDAMDRWFDVHAFPVGSGTPRLVAVLFTDVSAYRRAAIATQESEERLNQALAAGNGIIPTIFQLPARPSPMRSKPVATSVQNTASSNPAARSAGSPRRAAAGLPRMARRCASPASASTSPSANRPIFDRAPCCN